MSPLLQGPFASIRRRQLAPVDRKWKKGLCRHLNKVTFNGETLTSAPSFRFMCTCKKLRFYGSVVMCPQQLHQCWTQMQNIKNLFFPRRRRISGDEPSCLRIQTAARRKINTKRGSGSRNRERSRSDQSQTNCVSGNLLTSSVLFPWRLKFAQCSALLSTERLFRFWQKHDAWFYLLAATSCSFFSRMNVSLICSMTFSSAGAVDSKRSVKSFLRIIARSRFKSGKCWALCVMQTPLIPPDFTNVHVMLTFCPFRCSWGFDFPCWPAIVCVVTKPDKL